MATNVIKVRLKDASQNVLHPETEWSLVQDKPSIFQTNWNSILNKPSNLTTSKEELLFGHYYFPFPSQNHTMIYPAVRVAKRLETPNGQVGGYVYTYYSFDGGSWTEAKEPNRFTPGL